MTDCARLGLFFAKSKAEEAVSSSNGLAPRIVVSSGRFKLSKKLFIEELLSYARLFNT